MNASVIIATSNRASDLRDTLASLARISTPGTVELIVVDNRSTDDTRHIVEHAATWYPFPVRYLFEPEAGKYAALNAGIKSARGRIGVVSPSAIPTLHPLTSLSPGSGFNRPPGLPRAP
jgi:glycosyltransferase involved in cell wall biosynthesis